MVKWLGTLRAGQFAGIFLTPANLQRADRLNLSIRIERNRLFNRDCKEKWPVADEKRGRILFKAEIGKAEIKNRRRGYEATSSWKLRRTFSGSMGALSSSSIR